MGTSWKILVCRIVLCQTFTFVTAITPWAFHDIFDIFPMWSLIKIIFEFSAFLECTYLCVMLIVIKIKSLYSGVALFVVYFCHEYLIKSYHCLIIVRRTLPTKGSCSRGLVWRRSPPHPLLVSCNSSRLAAAQTWISPSQSVSSPSPDLIQQNTVGSINGFFKWTSLFVWPSIQRSLNLTVDSNISVFSDISRQTDKSQSLKSSMLWTLRFKWQATNILFETFDPLVNSWRARWAEAAVVVTRQRI